MHELDPKSTDSLEGTDYPHYICNYGEETGINHDGKSWHLYYPELFLRNLCLKSLQETKKYLISNNIDPLINYIEGNYWIDELNK